MKTQVISEKLRCTTKTGMISGPAAAAVSAAAGIVASETALDDDETLLGGRVYEHLGFLIVEGRSPAAAAAATTVKGRRDGSSAVVHCCPQSAGAAAASGSQAAAMAGSCGCCCGSSSSASKLARHQCKDVCDEQSSRAQAHRKEMATMWCNGIPLCVETLLCIACELDDGAAPLAESVGSQQQPLPQQQQHRAATDSWPLATDVARPVGLNNALPAASCPPSHCGHHAHHRHRGSGGCADSSVDEGGVRAGAYVLLEQWIISVQPERRVGLSTCGGSSAALGHHHVSSVAAVASAATAAACSSSAASSSSSSGGSSIGGGGSAANGFVAAGAGQSASAYACSLVDLVQAIKSHLYFSQLSAWLQISHGQRPRHVVYRLTTPGEWFRHSFMSDPVNHAFPAAVIGGRRHVVKVSLSSLPRTERTAPELCAEARCRHLLQQQQLTDHHRQQQQQQAAISLNGAPRSPPIATQRQHRSPGCWLDTMAEGTLLIEQSAPALASEHFPSGGRAGTARPLSPCAPSTSCSPSQSTSVHVPSHAPQRPEEAAPASLDPRQLLRQRQQRQLPLSLPPAPCPTTNSASSGVTVDPMGAFGESGARSVSEVTLIGCSVGSGNSHAVGCGLTRLFSPQLPPAAAVATAANRSCRSLRTATGGVPPPAAVAAASWPRQPSSATTADALLRCGTMSQAPSAAPDSTDSGVKMPPKSPKVLFSAWVNDGGGGRKAAPPLPLGDGGHTVSRQSAASLDLGLAADPSVSSCRMRLSFDDDDPDGGDECIRRMRAAPKRDGDGCRTTGAVEPCESAAENGTADRNSVGGPVPMAAEVTSQFPACSSSDGAASAAACSSSRYRFAGCTATAARPQSLQPATGGDHATCHRQSAALSDEGREEKLKQRQPVFELGDDAAGDGDGLAGCENCDDVSNRIGRSDVGPAAANMAAQSPSGGRMKRSGESFPRFSKLRLNERPASFSSQSSPAPVKRLDRRGFHFDAELATGGPKAIKSALSCGSLASQHAAGRAAAGHRRAESSGGSLSTSAPAAAASSLSSLPSARLAAGGAGGSLATSPAAACTPSSALLGNFEETLLNGRMEPAGVIDGFSVDLGASGSFCPQHVRLPVKAYFFGCLSDDNAPSPYLGYVDLQSLGKRGYQVPRKGTLQVTLFNPNMKVVKMFVVLYDLEDMPPRSQTFLRQRTVYAPTAVRSGGSSSTGGMAAEAAIVAVLPTYLRYLIHMRFATSKTGKLYLHTDLRLIFARDKFEFDTRVAASYEMRSYTEAPSNPKFSPFS